MKHIHPYSLVVHAGNHEGERLKCSDITKRFEGYCAGQFLSVSEQMRSSNQKKKDNARVIFRRRSNMRKLKKKKKKSSTEIVNIPIRDAAPR